MRKLLGSIVLCLGMSLFAGMAHADYSKFYYGMGVSDGSIKVNGVAGDTSMGSINGTFGLQFMNFVGLEVEVGASSDDPQSIFSESQVSYGAAMLRLGVRYGRVGVYALAGQAFLDTSSKFNFSESGNAVGIGLNLFGSETTSLNFHFLRLDEGAFTSATIGFQYYFGGYR